MRSTVRWGVYLAIACSARVGLSQEVTAPAAADAQAGGGESTQVEAVEVEVPGGEVVVLGNREGNVERTTTQVVSLLSSDDLARTGEGDIAGALSRVTGLSVVGGGFVYVRGLGDRYSLALLNGSPLPSPEPLRRAVPLNLFPTDIIASSLVQKTYSANFPGEFGGGVINLTTLSIPKTAFLNVSAGVSGDSETTGNTGYTYYGSSGDWTGYGNRSLSQPLQDFFNSGLRISAGAVNATEIAKTFVSPANGLVQHMGSTPANGSGSITGGNTWMIGDTRLGLIATAGYSNDWRTRDNTSQTPGNSDLSMPNKDYRTVITDNHLIANAMFGLGLETGNDARLRWTNVYIHDTLKEASLGAGRWNITYSDWDFIEQGTAWYERELLSTQLSGGMRFDSISLDGRAAYSRTSRNAPYELTMGYARTNIAADPYGEYFVNRLSGQNRNFANIVFSDLGEDQVSAGLDMTWRVMPDVVVQAGVDFADTTRDSTRREFQIRAPSTFPSAVGMFRPDYLLGSAVIEYYGIGLIETTESDPKFSAGLRTYAGYLQGQVALSEALDLSVGVRYENAKQQVSPVQVFNTQTNSGSGTDLGNDYFLPAATLTWRFDNDMQLRFSASQTLARPQFRELMFQRYYDPEAVRAYLGNPLLTDSKFTNVDARYEWYFNGRQKVSFGAFYKNIDKPIETYTTYPEGDSPVTSFANAPSAQLYGAELEFEKHFDFDTQSEFLASRRAVLIGNYTWTKSALQVGQSDTVQIFGLANTTRPAPDYFVDGSALTGQSDHLVNLEFGLENQGRVSQQTLMLSYASDRITSRAGGSWPDVRESPGMRVDFVAREAVSLFNQSMELKLEVRNIFA
ncbi:MAG: TonB-dependent receptor, partial [Nevskiaceae bacterium]|nr:TonB-dependent receptor [Nevskiaceae bacterium]